MHEVPLTIAEHSDEDATRSDPEVNATRLRKAVDAHFVFIGRSLRGLGVAESDVDDAIQQVFLVLSKKLPEISELGLRAFLFQTAVRIASRARRTRARRQEVGEETLDATADERASPEELTEQRRARELLDRILDDMDMELRSVLVLFEIEELTTQEIAVLLEIPQGTAASRLRRAREEFHARVKRLQASGGVR